MNDIDDPDRYGKMDMKAKRGYQYLVYLDKYRDKFRRAFYADEK